MTKQTEPRKNPHHAVVPLNGNKYGLARNYRVITQDFDLARSRHMSRYIPTQRQNSAKNLTRLYKREVLGRAARSTLTIEKIIFNQNNKYFCIKENTCFPSAKMTLELPGRC